MTALAHVRPVRTGRPPVYPPGTDTRTLATRVPEPIRAYLTVLAARRKIPVTLIYKEALEVMLARKPYHHGLEFRVAPARDTEKFPQVNVIVPEKLAEQVEQDAQMQDTSIASYVCTAIYFYARYVVPPKRYR